MPDRGGFFKEMLREVLNARASLNAALESLNDPEPDPWRPEPPRAAGPATALVDEARLVELARTAGLEHRVDDVRRTARAGVRLTPAAVPGQSRLGGTPLVPAGFEWPTWYGRELAFVAQIDLAEVAAAGVAGTLPREGLLLVFAELAATISGLAPEHAGSSRAVFVPPGVELVHDARSPQLREVAVEPTRELQLPSAWSYLAEPLALEPDEADAWDELRALLAQEQGVELEDAGGGPIALHRLLGYQDENGREVELDCQLASSGIDAADVMRYYELRDEHEAGARRWRLLLQVTADETIRLGEGGERLFVCIRDDDLRAGRFDEVWALLR
ncbi:MAG TPA: DUF1963 domain-containing protein [Gaiellaceae bacterium]|nr:DUF1963 domain-containing protein [Gaiellaceae bacterium]